MEIKSLSKKDYGKIIDFAIRGMHLDWYIKNKTILRLYGRYFLYLELNKATQIFAAYEGMCLSVCCLPKCITRSQSKPHVFKNSM